MQNNITVATNEKDLNVTYGMINFHPEREQARTSLKYILSDVNDIRKSYIRLGFHLHEFDRLKYYEDLYDKQVRGGQSKFKQVDRELAIVNLMRVNLLDILHTHQSHYLF